MGLFNRNIMDYVYFAIALVISLPFHEFAHAYIAHKMGDDTAKYQGRLTINPLAHLDIIGTISMLLVGVGWAKPVPVNPYNFKNPKRGMALTSLAGPVSNLLLATVFMIAEKICAYVGIMSGLQTWNGGLLPFFYNLFLNLYMINVSLAIFNLLPIPPLDGSRILNLVLPEKLYFQIMQYERYIMLGLFLLLFLGVLDGPLSFLNRIISQGLYYLTYFVDLIFKAII